MKNLFKTFLALICLAMPVTATDKRELVTLNGSTVADVICSQRDGHVGFKIPLAPQFTQRNLFESFPKGMNEYPALYKTQTGTITTAAMIRFIKQGHALFTNKQDQEIYKKLLKEAIDAHKEWYTETSKENLDALKKAENNVFEQLKPLSLNSPEIRSKLEVILSSPQRNIISKGLRSLILPNRAWIFEKEKKDLKTKLMIKKSNFILNFTKQGVAALGPFAILAAFAHIIKHLPDKTKLLLVTVIFAVIANIPVSSLLGTAASFTDFKLTPEPGNGIKVVIDYVSPSATAKSYGEIDKKT